MTVLQVDGLKKSFGARRVLRDVSFRIDEGEIVGLVGTNGAGKSTMGDILAGITAADAGTMTLKGHPYAPLSAADARHLGVGGIEQLVRIDPGLTVAQAVFRGTPQAGRPQAELREQAQVLLTEVGLDLGPDTPVGELPHFVHGLVEIARMLAEDTDLVVLDEVSAALLPGEVSGLHAVAGRLSRQGRGVLYISHRLPEMLEVVDRVLVLREGRIALDSPAGALDPVRLAAETVGGPVAPPARRMAPVPQPIGDADAGAPAVPRPARSDEVALLVRNLRVPGAVEGVDLLVHRGEVVGLTGPRSSGLSEIAAALSGELPAITDEVLLHGEPRLLAARPEDDALRLPAYRPDEDAYGVDPGETIARTLSQERWGALTDLRKEIDTLRGVIRTVHRMDVKTLSIRTAVGALSGGDQHKLALARWMANAARDVVVLHEPTRGLDVRARQQVRQLLDDATALGKAVVVVSVDPDELAECCDRIGVVSGGRVERWIDTGDQALDTVRDRIVAATAA
ncbi:ATP-binding cassette domain-containing protein [Modestobacter sp. I12A-02662]|uniref:ATP-binding cassette domain-containing protein n=1 Tax=Modestobacter sp. I12A-02662 TaxID=1730496 RepID=UPI0034DDEDCE